MTSSLALVNKLRMADSIEPNPPPIQELPLTTTWISPSVMGHSPSTKCDPALYYDARRRFPKPAGRRSRPSHYICCRQTAFLHIMDHLNTNRGYVGPRGG